MARKKMFGLVVILLSLSAFAAAESVPMLFYGEASWYGEKFHGRRTANGEIYDMNKLTAAHRTLPFGTLVEVTNLENDQKVTVVINDRGPFAKGRILDLSKEAARQLGFLEAGVAKVEVRVLEVGRPGMQAPGNQSPSTNRQPASDADLGDFPTLEASPTPRGMSPETPAMHSDITIRYAVQVGAFARSANANDLASAINRNGSYTAYVVPPAGSGLYRVLIGPYSSRSQADQARNSLTTQYPDAFIRETE